MPNLALSMSSPLGQSKRTMSHCVADRWPGRSLALALQGGFGAAAAPSTMGSKLGGSLRYHSISSGFFQNPCGKPRPIAAFWFRPFSPRSLPSGVYHRVTIFSAPVQHQGGSLISKAECCRYRVTHCTTANMSFSGVQIQSARMLSYDL